MSLKYLLQEWSKETGQPTTSDNQRANAVEKINRAAREIWDSSDLPGSLREQVFDIDNTQKQVTLPYYVDQIRGIRHYSSRARIKLNDMRPRYSIGNWIQPLLSYRNKEIVAIGHSITNEAPVTIQLTAANSVDFRVNIRASTSTSSSTVDSILISAGETQVVSSIAPTSFPGILNIEKDQKTEVDLSVIDTNGVILAQIPNNELASRYTKLQVEDATIIVILIDHCYEFLYKQRFSGFWNDYDNYPAEGYDDIILWKALSNFWKKKPGATEQATTAEATLMSLLTQKAANAEAGQELEMNFNYDRFKDVAAGGYPTGWPNTVPYRVV